MNGKSPMFNERKAAQMAAYLLFKRADRMSHLKLMKLLYLADRESMRQRGIPISWDRMVSMPHGPVLSMTLNYMDGSLESAPDGWESWVSDKEDHELLLREHRASSTKTLSLLRQALDQLSDAEIEILDSVWQRFGHMTRWALRDYTHRHCPEWEDPHGSSKPISPSAVFRALGRDIAEADKLEQAMQEERGIDALFARL